MSGAITAGTLATVAGIGAAGSIGGALISSNAAGNAASQQAQAANNAAQLQYQASQNALGFQEGQYQNSQAELAPWLQSGSQALSNLNYLLGNGQAASQTPVTSPNPATGEISTVGPINTSVGATSSGTMQPVAGSGTSSVPGTGASAGSPINVTATPNTSLGAAGSLMAAYPGGPFTAPTAEQAAQTPGYQFQLQQGQQALQQSAAARGNLLTGGTAEALDNYSQGLAASNYQNVYNNALSAYNTNYNAYQNQQTNEYNRLAALAGVGQQTASTLGTLGQNASNSIASNITGTAQQMGQDYTNAAAANASGIYNSAAAWNSGIGGVGKSANNYLSNLIALQKGSYS